MTLIDENEVIFEQEKKRKRFNLIVKIIIALIAVLILLIMVIQITKSKTIKVSVNGQVQNNVDNELILKDEKGKILEENGEIYISAQKLSTMLNCQYYNSEYKKKGEDKTKCQVKVQNVYTSFVSNSNNVYKAIVNEQTEETKNNMQNVVQNSTQSNTTQSILESENDDTKYEYFTIKNNVKYVNEEIYISKEAAELGFDVSISYDAKKKTISIYTLDKLEEVAKGKRTDVVSSSEYEYYNKRLLKYGMCIIKNSDGNLGVGSYTDSNKVTASVVSCKYSEIKFNEANKTLTVKTSNDNKKCILYLNLENQEVENNITSQYDDIKEIDNSFKYFMIKDDNKYGIINSDGKIIIYQLFEEIGIDEEKYTNINNKYILDGKYVPVKQNGVWGLYNIDGKKLINPQYQGFGCDIAQCGDASLIIPNIKENIDGVVFLYNKEKSLYGVYNAENGEKIAISLTEVFSKFEENKLNYYINYAIDKENAIVHTLNAYTDL